MDRDAAIGQLWQSLYEYDYKAQNPPTESGLIASGKRTYAAGAASTQATAEIGQLMIQVDRAPHVKELINKVANGSNSVKPLADAIAQKWKQDPQLIQKLESDLSNDKTGTLQKRLEQSLLSNQKVGAQTITVYDGKNLSALLPAAAEPKPTGAAAPQTTAQAASTPTKPVSHAKPTAQPPQKLVEPAAVAAAPAATPIPTEAAPSAPQPTLAAGTGAATATPAPAVPEHAAESDVPPPPNGAPKIGQLYQSAFANLANASDAEISEFFSGNDAGTKVKQIGDTIADNALKLGVSESNVAGFKKYFDDPKNQQAVIKNLKENPKFVKTLAEFAKEGDGVEIPEAFKEPMRKEMDKLIQNPDNLASDKYAKHLVGRVNNVKLLNQISGFAKDFLGIDLTGIFTKILAAFNSPDGPLQGFMDALKNMGRAGSLHLPSNQGKNFFSRVFDNPQHSMYERQAMAATPTNGSLFHEVELKGADGKVTKVQRPNTVQVQSAEGKPVDLIPAAGAALVEVRGDAYRVRVPSGINQDGTVKTTQDAWLNKQGYEDYKRAAESGGVKMNEDIARIDADWKQLREQQRGPRVYVERESGQTTEVAQPAAPSVSTAEQDARMPGKTALDHQTSLGLMTGPTGA
ncbi:MAG TPA: hypothetical protein PKI93_03105 [Alphaproteobacteria bacterium]|nr:hypothetical protein [Alphaproteobacteria bacterium]HNS44132.1 hypothetical protein [Alphaproteobacteria bacterium]